MATSDGFRQSDEGEQETTAAYRGWNDLPNELNDEIFPYIWRFTDFYNLCLVSTKMRLVAMPHLYRTVVIDPMDLSRSYYLFLRAYSKARINPGWQYTKAVRFLEYPKGEQSGSKTANLQDVIRQSLELVSKDTLQCLITPSALPITTDILRTLCTTQRRIQHIEISGLMPGTGGCVEVFRCNWTGALRSIVVNEIVGGEQELMIWRDIIRSKSELTALSLRCDAFFDIYLDGRAEVTYVRNDREIDPFGSLIRLDPERNGRNLKPIRVQHLTLDRQNVLDRGPQLWKTFDIGRLQFLTIKYFYNIRYLLQNLANVFADLRTLGTGGPALRGLRLCCNEYDLNTGLYNLLRSFSGLEVLSLCGSDLRTIDWSRLSTHASTLRHLSIRVDEDLDASNVYPTPILNSWAAGRILQDMSNLEQLGISLPSIGSSAFTGFSVEMDELAGYLNSEAMRLFLSSIVKIPRLKTLLLLFHAGHEERLILRTMDTAEDFMQSIVHKLAQMYKSEGKGCPVKLLALGNSEQFGRSYRNVKFFRVDNRCDTTTGELHLECSEITGAEAMNIHRAFDVDGWPWSKGRDLGLGGLLLQRWQFDQE